ncbi:organelle RRM domain-containing protein 1, chloroplastic isoform X2 [Cryptomeria japonica]|uniref:organelle RRM domain-containing protein 1, chloroplastic isoform X2 n=1 Tax=Cryptomeria japonica TaxID=3369 RepID=UPI0027DA6FD7|nr:organelle RRM domain-containing protein 1, chloroplastic isoform X2 [Cryptomeria japonica]
MALISGPYPYCSTIIPTKSRLNSHSLSAGASTCISTRIWTCSPAEHQKSPLLRSGLLGIVACFPAPSSFASEECAPRELLINTKKLFVSGLSFLTTEDSFRKCFSRFGQLVEAKIIMDKFAKRSKGFGFIEYATETEAQEAILGMDGKGHFCGSCKT